MQAKLVTIIYLLCMSFVCSAQSNTKMDSISFDQMWSNENYRLVLTKNDSSFSFTKNDEPLVDYIAGKFLNRNDTIYFYTADENRMLYFTLYEEDSIHRKIIHVDPRVYNAYNGNFPTYFYLNKIFDDNGKLSKEFLFIKKGDLSKEPKQLQINTFSEHGTLFSTLVIWLHSSKASYVEYEQGNSQYPKAQLFVKYRNGKILKSKKY